LSAFKTVRRADRHKENARLRRYADVWNQTAREQTRNSQAPVTGVPDQPSSAGEIVSPPVQPQAWDTLDWLNLWNWNNPAGTNEVYDDFHYVQQDHLSPRLEAW
jgi:hypothetical protein